MLVVDTRRTYRSSSEAQENQVDLGSPALARGVKSGPTAVPWLGFKVG